MPTIGSTNLQDTPSAGPLTEADLDRSAGNLAPRIPRDRRLGLGAVIPVAAVLIACGVLYLVMR